MIQIRHDANKEKPESCPILPTVGKVGPEPKRRVKFSSKYHNTLPKGCKKELEEINNSVTNKGC